MKLYFNKNFGEYVCAGNGVAAMDADKANAIKMALDVIERDNTEKAINELSAYDTHILPYLPQEIKN